MSDACAVLDRKWRYTYVNRATERITNHLREEMLGRTISAVLAERAPKLEAACRRAMDQGVAVHFEEYYPGVENWLEYTVYPSADRVTVMARDITRRVEIEKALQESEERFRRYFELGLIGMAITSPTKGILEVNDYICEILGYERSELLQSTWEQLTYPDDLAADLETFNRVLAREIDGYAMDKRWIRKDGRVIDTIISVKCIRRMDGSVDYFVALLQDITERKRAERASRASEERLRLLVESAEDYAIITLDKEGRVSGWSSGATRLFGYEEREIMGRSGEVLFTPEDRELGLLVEEMNLASERNRAVNERYYLRKDGTRVFGSGVTSVLHDHDTQGYVKIVRDLTGRQQAEEALRHAHEELEERIVERTRALTSLNEELRNEIFERKRAQEELRRSEVYLVEGQILSHTGSGSWRVSTGDVFWSEEMYRIFGFEPGTVKPSSELFFGLVHPDERFSLERAFEKVVLQRSSYNFEFRIVRPDGAIRYMQSIGRLIFNESADLSEVVGTIMDITDRKHAEEKLVASERRFRLMAESIPHHVWSFHIDGSVGYCNRRLTEYTGLTAEELGQDGCTPLHPNDVERCRAAWREAWANGTSFDVEQRVLGRNGRYRRFLCRGVPVSNDEGQVVEWYGTNTDVEDLRQTQETLHALQTELAHMARVTTMGELAASIAHEVNQPLTAVIANSDAGFRWLARDTPNPEEAQQCLSHITEAAHRATEVINRIRTFLKRGPPEQVLLDIDDLIRDTIPLVSRVMVRNQVSLQTDFAVDLPPISGDRIQLQQVMLNLVMNAIEAISARGDGPREILLTSRAEEAGEIVVTVRDSGVGIEEGKMEQLFKPFFTTKDDGMGMGLAISRSLIEAHGGRLWAVSGQREGATFQFSLPVHALA